MARIPALTNDVTAPETQISDVTGPMMKSRRVHTALFRETSCSLSQILFSVIDPTLSREVWQICNAQAPNVSACERLCEDVHVTYYHLGQRDLPVREPFERTLFPTPT